jgi:hypothetical protein
MAPKKSGSFEEVSDEVSSTDFRKEASNWPSVQIEVTESLVFVAYLAGESDWADRPLNECRNHCESGSCSAKTSNESQRLGIKRREYPPMIRRVATSLSRAFSQFNALVGPVIQTKLELSTVALSPRSGESAGMAETLQPYSWVARCLRVGHRPFITSSNSSPVRYLT